MTLFRNHRVGAKGIFGVLLVITVGVGVLFRSPPRTPKMSRSELDPSSHEDRPEVEAATIKLPVVTAKPFAVVPKPVVTKKINKPSRIAEEGENVKVGENTEVHVLSAIYRADYPYRNSFNVVLLTWVGSQRTDRSRFFCCLSATPQFSAVTQTPAFMAFVQPWGAVRTDMRYILYSCSLKSDRLTLPPTELRFVAFSESVCAQNMTGIAREITIPEEGRNKFAICKSFAYGHIEPSQLVEWFEFAKVTGVSKVQVHYNNISDESLNVLRHYQREGFLILIPCNPAGRKGAQARGFAARDHQKFMDKRVILNDCLHRLSGYDYVAVVDFDELLIPRIPYNNLMELMKNASSRFPDAGVFYANSYLNLLEWPDTNANAAISYMRRMDRTESDSIDNVVGQRSSPKIIFDPKRMIGVETHSVTAFRANYIGYHLPRRGYALLHFRACKQSAWGTCDFKHFVDGEVNRFHTRWLQGIHGAPLLALNCSEEYQRNITRELRRMMTHS